MRFDIELDEAEARSLVRAYSPENLANARYDLTLKMIIDQMGTQIPLPVQRIHFLDIDDYVIGRILVRRLWTPVFYDAQVILGGGTERHGQTGAPVQIHGIDRDTGTDEIGIIIHDDTLFLRPGGWIEVLR